MNDNTEKSIKETYEGLKRAHENELENFRLNQEEEANKQGYYYCKETDRYEKYPVIKICEVLLVSIGVNEINAVKRYERISDENYEMARTSIDKSDKKLALNVLNNIADYSADFFNTLSFTYGTKNVRMLHEASEESITRFIKPKDLLSICFKDFGSRYNEMLGSFEFDIPYYHVTLTFFEVEKTVLDKLTEGMISEGKFYTIERTWHEKWIDRSLM